MTEANARVSAGPDSRMGAAEKTLIVCLGLLACAFVACVKEGGEEARVARQAITMSLNDPAFVGRAVRAGYRTEMVIPGDGKYPYLLARCARTDATGPAQCDPFPDSDGRYDVKVTH